MPITETLKTKGSLNIVVTGPNGDIKEDVHVDNLVVTVGKEYIASRMKEIGRQDEMSHMAVGSDNTAPAAGDTTLGAEESRSTLSTAGGTVTGSDVVYEATFTSGTLTLTEAGIFNDSTAGTLLCRTTFNAINKGEDDSVAITWTFSVL